MKLLNWLWSPSTRHLILDALTTNEVKRLGLVCDKARRYAGIPPPDVQLFPSTEFESDEDVKVSWATIAC